MNLKNISAYLQKRFIKDLSKENYYKVLFFLNSPCMK